jgi:hypothetical protein
MHVLVRMPMSICTPTLSRHTRCLLFHLTLPQSQPTHMHCDALAACAAPPRLRWSSSSDYHVPV